MATASERNGAKGGVARRPNPFDGEAARENSSYAAFSDGRLLQVPSQERAASLQEFVHDSFRALVLNPKFSCVGAKSALRRGGYRFGLYDSLDSPGATAGLARDLFEFVEDQPSLEGEFTTFVASFGGPITADERQFEKLLWAQLQRLHEEDRPHHSWAPAVSPDPEDSNFAFSFAGRAFFVVGLHPGASRFARRFAWPTLIFNAHEQFEKLREEGRFGRLRDVIRARDMNLQGDLNPNLSDFGEFPEARQYSGRPAEEDWRCPFHPGASAEGEEG